jgi:outer membrane receptor protein involved in Fe transport
MYVDNVPYFDKTSFDFDFFDLSRIEILRGPQGTLYGRNSMGGLINVYTLSPREWQGTRARISTGSHGLLQAKVSHYMKVGEKFAFSLGGNYSATGGFRKNVNPAHSPDVGTLASKIYPSHHGKENAGAAQSASLRLNLDWRPLEKLSFNYTGSYEYAEQNGYAYGKYSAATGLPDSINYNDPIFYGRDVFNNSLRIEYAADRFKIASTTGFQALKDSLQLDNDFAPESMFTLFQKQDIQSVNEEITIRSTNAKHFRWIGGVSGFYNKTRTDSKVTFKDDGIAFILESIKNAGMPFQMDITSATIPVTGDYTTKNHGLAAFAQLTHDFGVEGLSASAGLRADYEKVAIDYINRSNFDYTVTMPGPPRPISGSKLDSIDGGSTMEFTQILPKFALRYERSGKSAFASVSKGYRAGGYNLQMFSDLMSLKMRAFNRPLAIDANDAISFKSEYSWNFEIGGRLSLCNDRINAGLALFYMDIRDQQIAEFAPNAQGRMIKNAEKSESRGIEFDALVRPLENLALGLNYGYTKNTFVKYTKELANSETIDYAGKFVPFVPQHTVSLTADYTLTFKRSFVEKLSLGARCSGAGRIYWTETNEASQKFYSLLDGKITVEKGAFALGVWGRNLAGTEYSTFYFKNIHGRAIGQLGKPVHFGADLNVKF